METKTVKLAYYESLTSEYNSQTVFTVCDYMENSAESGYARVSNIIEVEFEMHNSHDTILLKVEALREKKAKFNAKIDEQIQKLMALPNPEDFNVEVEDMGGAR